MFVYLYIYIYIYICTHIPMHIHIGRRASLRRPRVKMVRSVVLASASLSRGCQVGGYAVLQTNIWCMHVYISLSLYIYIYTYIIHIYTSLSPSLYIYIYMLFVCWMCRSSVRVSLQRGCQVGRYAALLNTLRTCTYYIYIYIYI